jgi:hypothetical protein
MRNRSDDAAHPTRMVKGEFIDLACLRAVRHDPAIVAIDYQLIAVSALLAYRSLDPDIAIRRWAAAGAEEFHG